MNIYSLIAWAPLPIRHGHMGRVCIDRLNPLCIEKQNAKGFRMTPCNISEMVC